MGSHAERGGSRGYFAANLTQSNDAEHAAVESPHPRESPPIGSGRVAPVEGRVGPAASENLLDADQPVEIGHPSGQHQHQGKSVLGARDVGATAHGQNLDPARRAGGDVDVAENGAVFVYDLQPRRQCEFCRANLEGFGDDRLCRPKIAVQLVLGLHQPDVARVQGFCSRFDLVAPGTKIRQIGRHEISECGPALGTGRRIEDDADQARPNVVFHDQHGLLGLHCWTLDFQARSK
jgi:hypothetical protein